MSHDPKPYINSSTQLVILTVHTDVVGEDLGEPNRVQKGSYQATNRTATVLRYNDNLSTITT